MKVMNNRKIKHITLVNRTFDTSLEIIINCSPEKFEKSVRKIRKDKNLKIELPEGSGAFYEISDGETRQVFYFLWIEVFDWSASSQALMVHELLHYAMAVFQDRGIPISRDNEETLAYFMQYCVSDIFWQLRKLNPVYNKASLKSKFWQKL